MVRAERKDTPGSWHHGVNRSVERRSIFAGLGDFRFFLSRLARVSRLGLLELHAYCLLQNHFRGLAVATAGTILKVIRAREHRQGPWIVGSDRSPVSAWAILACGLLRSACNLALLEVAVRLECAESSVHRRTTTHLSLVASDEEYAAVSAEILRQAIRIDFAPACMARDSCSSEGGVSLTPCDGGGR